MVRLPPYLVLEGIPGSGKSTQIRRLQSSLRRRDIIAITLCEPTFGRYGIQARQLVNKKRGPNADEEVAAFRRDRAEHVRQRVRPLLDFLARHPGFVLLQDRSYLSSPVFQGEGDRIRMQRLLEEERVIAERPGLTIVLDVPTSVASQRLADRAKVPNRFAAEALLESARQCFLELQSWVDERIEIIDGVGQAPDVTRCILQVLESTRLIPPRGKDLK